MKGWIKGGLIGGGIAIILIAVSIYLAYLDIFEDIPSLVYFLVIFTSQCGFLTQCVGEGCMSCLFITPFIAFFEFILIGCLLGLVFEKVNEKNKKIIRIILLNILIIFIISLPTFYLLNPKYFKKIQESKDYELFLSAKDQKNYSICQKIVEIGRKDECFANVAVLKDDLDMCKNVNYMKFFCFSQLALNRNNKSICYHLDSYQIDDCLRKF